MSMLTSSNKSTDTNNLFNKHLDYNPIYKVNYLVNGSIDTIFIFYGNKNECKENDDEFFRTIFTDKEIDEIQFRKFKDESKNNNGTLRLILSDKYGYIEEFNDYQWSFKRRLTKKEIAKLRKK